MCEDAVRWRASLGNRLVSPMPRECSARRAASHAACAAAAAARSAMSPSSPSASPPPPSWSLHCSVETRGGTVVITASALSSAPASALSAFTATTSPAPFTLSAASAAPRSCCLLSSNSASSMSPSSSSSRACETLSTSTQLYREPDANTHKRFATRLLELILSAALTCGGIFLLLGHRYRGRCRAVVKRQQGRRWKFFHHQLRARGGGVLGRRRSHQVRARVRKRVCRVWRHHRQ